MVLTVATAAITSTPAVSTGRDTVRGTGSTASATRASAAATGTSARYHSAVRKSSANGSTAIADTARPPATKLQNGAIRCRVERNASSASAASTPATDSQYPAGASVCAKGTCVSAVTPAATCSVVSITRSAVSAPANRGSSLRATS